jgi:replicative DNA helicase
MESTLEELEVSTPEVKAINAVLKSKDKNLLYAPAVDDLFTAYGDVWNYVKDYTNKYGDLPSFEVTKERFGDDLPEVAVQGKTEYYFDELRTTYVSNRMESLLKRAAKEFTAGTSAAEVKDRLQVALGKLDRFSSTSIDLNIMDMEGAAMRYEEVRSRALAMGGTPGIPTGIDFVDACMPLGLQGGDILSLIGYPARGKSALGTLIAANAIKRGFKPLIFSREMSAAAVQDRIFTVMGSGIFSNSDLMLGDVNKDDFREFSTRASGEGWIIDGNGTGDMTPNFIHGKVDQHRSDFVIMDYLQLFNDNRLSEDMTTRMRNLSLEVKNMSNQTNVPFVVISSATPPDGGKIDGPPNVERSAWSRQLAYDSTVSIAVHRIDGTNYYQVECAKNRYGPLFSGFLEWDMDRGIIAEKFNL